MYPAISCPIPSLYIIFRNGSGPIRTDTKAYALPSGMDPNRSDPILSDTGAYTHPAGMDLTRPDPIPELIHPFPEWARLYPTRYRSLHIIFRWGTGPIPKLIHPLPEWIGSYPIRYRSLYIHYTNSSDPFRPDTGAYTSLSCMDPIRYRRFDILFRNGSDPIRSDTEACTSFPGLDPTLSEPIPKLIPILPEWTRPDPIRYRSSYISFRNGSDFIRPDIGAYIYHNMEPILSDPIQKLVHPFPEWTRSL
jgi:hypothetical protein